MAMVVLEGGFTDGGERFAPGDFVCLETRPLLAPLADPARGCVCLATYLDPDGVLVR
jgi:hypothetical protein